MKKKYIIRGIIVIILAGMILLGIRFIYPYIFSDEDNGLDSYDYLINYLNEEVSFKLLSYGEQINIRDGLECVQIEDISEENLDFQEDYVYLVINDLKGSVDLTCEKVELLKKYCDKNSNFNFIYLGKDKLKLFQGGIFQDYGISEEEMSFGYVMDEGYRIIYGGIWTKTEDEIFQRKEDFLGESVLSSIVLIIKTNE